MSCMVQVCSLSVDRQPTHSRHTHWGLSSLWNLFIEARKCHVAHCVWGKYRSMLMNATHLAVGLSASFPSGNGSVIVVMFEQDWGVLMNPAGFFPPAGSRTFFAAWISEPVETKTPAPARVPRRMPGVTYRNLSKSEKDWNCLCVRRCFINVAAEWLTLLFRVRELPGSSLIPETVA